MPQSLAELKSTLSVLPVPQRAELAQYLLGTLDDEEEGAPEAWQSLAEERLADLRSGKVTGIPADEVMKTLRGRGA
jgi:putative addiction module component (TIGR02574 family)